MPLPDNWTTRTLTGEYQLAGEPLKGSVTFTPTERVVDAAAGVIQPPGGKRVSLDADGKFSLPLPVVDDPDVSPTGWAWRVLEELTLPTGQRYTHTYDIQVTSAMGSTVKLADLAPVTDVAEVSPYLRGVDLGTVVETPAGAQAKASAAQVAAIADAATKYPTHEPKLRKWYGALANRHASIASIVVIGDSISEGTGSTSIRRRWQQVLQSELRGRFQPPGVAGASVPYISASPRLIPVPSDYGLTVVGAVTNASFGLGLKAATVATGQSLTFTFTGTRAKLYASKGPSVGRYSIVLNGAAEVVVDGFNSGTLLSGQMVWDSGALTAGTHTVVVSRAASTTANPGNVFPEGLANFNGDEVSGVRVVDAARHGSVLSTFTASTAWHTAFGAVQGAGLLIMPWGANDSTAGTTAAAFRAGLDAIIANARTAGFAGSILLVEMPKRGSAAEQVWTDYRAQIDAVAAADPDITTLDLRARMPDYGTTEATALALYADEVHYTDKGQGWIADQIATAITPR